jgi:hypothetical protein
MPNADYQLIKNNPCSTEINLREAYIIYYALRVDSAKFKNDVYLLSEELNLPNEACGKVHLDLIQTRLSDNQIIIQIMI